MRLAFLKILPWWGWAISAGLFALGIGGGKALGSSAKDAMRPKQPTGARPVLKVGAVGPWVTFLQSLLGVQGELAFGPATDGAVRAFQKSKGLGVDGVVGNNTWNALGVTGAASAPSSTVNPKAAVNTTAPPSSPAPPPNGTLSTSLATREQQILEAIAGGDGIIEWVPITSSANGHTATILVTRRPVAIQMGGGKLIVSASFRTAQKIADMLGASMLTSKVSDLMWQQAQTRLQPTNRPWVTDGSMGNTARMFEQSAYLEQRAGGSTGITGNEGKDWILTKRFWTGPDTPEGTKSSRHNSSNYGWYLSPSSTAVIQSNGMAHDKNHADYSQLLRFMQSTVIVDGSPMQMQQVLSDPVLSALVSDEGPLPATRHPDL